MRKVVVAVFMVFAFVGACGANAWGSSGRMFGEKAQNGPSKYFSIPKAAPAKAESQKHEEKNLGKALGHLKHAVEKAHETLRAVKKAIKDLFKGKD
ncbi:MAG: hypothetical protein HQL11_03820, partial [Candidatus Omnitrophica bacterium]|nr:hypothetical protein [Candidatus Omnitrophota bacterium]